jgi:hypothetical protein
MGAMCEPMWGVAREEMGVRGWWPYDWSLIDGCEGCGGVPASSVSIEIDQWAEIRRKTGKKKKKNIIKHKSVKFGL